MSNHIRIQDLSADEIADLLAAEGATSPKNRPPISGTSLPEWAVWKTPTAPSKC